MKAIFTNLVDTDYAHLLAKIGIALMYYGLLRCEEVIMLKIKDILVLNEQEIIVKFPYATKTRDAGFEYYVPKNLVPSFQTYIGQIAENQGPATRFMKNINLRSKKRYQNTGIKAVSRWIDIIGVLLNKDMTGYTTHTFRRSAATTLADNGVTMWNLKRYGRWTSETCAEGYVDNSRKMKADRLALLGAELSDSLLAKKRVSFDGMGADKNDSPNSPKIAKMETTASSFETNAKTVIYQNCAMYSSSQMTIGATPPPPPPPAQVTPEEPNLIQLLYDELIGKGDKGEVESGANLGANDGNA